VALLAHATGYDRGQMPAAAVLATDPSPRRPTFAFMLSHPAHLLALGFGSGLVPFAPGTWGTLWAWISFLVLQRWLSPVELGAVVILALPVGWWACTVTAGRLGAADPSAIVWDEIAAFWIVLALVMPASWGAQLAAFLLFRFFDAAKPGPMGWADRKFKGGGWRGGFGILVDDVVAAFCTLLALALWRTWR
jgi:phosphatidylglycerophosphatase A